MISKTITLTNYTAIPMGILPLRSCVYALGKGQFPISYSGGRSRLTPPLAPPEFILLRRGFGPFTPSSSTRAIQKSSALSAEEREFNSATASALRLFGVGFGRITIGRLIPSCLVSAGENWNLIRRRWEMVINGDVCVGSSPR
jgi:hypothetical protein